MLWEMMMSEIIVHKGRNVTSLVNIRFINDYRGSSLINSEEFKDSCKAEAVLIEELLYDTIPAITYEHILREMFSRMIGDK